MQTNDFDADNIVFGAATINDNYVRVPLGYNYRGQIKRLCIDTGAQCLSTGLVSKRNVATSLIYHSLPLYLSDPSDAAGEPQRQETLRVVEQTLKKVKEHLKKPQTKKTLGKHSLDDGLIDQMEMMYVPKTDAASRPRLWVKIDSVWDAERAAAGLAPRLKTQFADWRDKSSAEAERLHPVALRGPCRVQVRFSVRCIYVGAEGVKPSLQIVAEKVFLCQRLENAEEVNDDDDDDDADLVDFALKF